MMQLGFESSSQLYLPFFKVNILNLYSPSLSSLLRDWWHQSFGKQIPTSYYVLLHNVSGLGQFWKVVILYFAPKPNFSKFLLTYQSIAVWVIIFK